MILAIQLVHGLIRWEEWVNKQPRFETQTRHARTDDGISGLTAAPHQVGFSAERLEHISPAVQKFIDDEQLAGAVTIVARRGKVAHFEAYGLMDLKACKPMQEDTIFRIYFDKQAVRCCGNNDAL